MARLKKKAISLDQFKTKPFAHQLSCLDDFGSRKFFALLAEQGTGKTWIIINNAADLWLNGQLETMLVLAPNGVHFNWMLLEIPQHMPEWVNYQIAAWSASATVKERHALEEIKQETSNRQFRILVMNVEAIGTKRGYQFAKAFCLSSDKTMIVADESDAYKNPSATRTRRLMRLKEYASFRRIMNGTPVTRSPFDVYSQFKFLSEDILGEMTFREFKEEYAKLLPRHHRLVKRLMEKGRLRIVPPIVKKDAEGKPIYRNLDQLQQLIEPHSFRVLKKDCLDLPEKIYKTVWFELTPEQRRLYKKAEIENRLTLNGEDIPFDPVIAQMKLMQITSGYYLHPEADEPVRIEGKNPKLELLIERALAVLSRGEKLIVWARFRVQIKDIVDRLRTESIQVVEYHGGVNKEQRSAAIESFERGIAQVFVGQQQAGGKGITLVAASEVFYFSNTFGLGDRLQSEDRAHRIGQRNKVIYTDFCAKGTVDYTCIQSLRYKKEVADQVTGDNQ